MTPSGEISQEGLTDWTQQYNQQGAETLETAQLGTPQQRAAVEAKVWATDQVRQSSETQSWQVRRVEP